MLVKISFSWRNEKACNCFNPRKLLTTCFISDWFHWSEFQQHHKIQNFVEGVTFPCFAMTLVRRKLYNKMQLNIQYIVYQLSERVDKRQESQETGWFCTSCCTILNWCRGCSIITFRLKGAKGTVRTAGRESSVRKFGNNLF